MDFAKLSDKPMYFSEIGADSYMSTSVLGYAQGLNQHAQADATQALLAPLFSDSVGAPVPPFFSFTDGWWKAGRSDVQDAGGVALRVAEFRTIATPTKNIGGSWTFTGSQKRLLMWSNPFSTRTTPRA